MHAGSYNTYDDFWLDYLRAHSKPETRAVHYAGETFGIVFAFMFLTTYELVYGLLAILAPYAFAWASHIFIQGNQPVSFTFPFWSLISGIKMYALWITGSLGPELDRAGVPLLPQR